MRSENLRRSLDKSVLDPDLEISGGEGGGRPFGPQFGLKIRGGPGSPRPLPWIRHCRLSSVSSRSLGSLDAPGSTAQLEAEATRELKQRPRRRQRDRQKSNRFRLANNNSARASRFLIHFFAVVARLRRESA